MATVIVGTGIIGVSTAYYMCKLGSTPPSSIHLLESSSKPFASASGFAAGFLARDWFSPSVASLGELSFDLHKRLAEENNGWEKWGYSRSTGMSLADTGGKRGENWLREGNSRADAAGEHEFVDGDSPTWLVTRKGRNTELISRGTSTAQVDPLRLSQFLLSECLSLGVNLHLSCRPKILLTDPLTGTIKSIHLESTSRSDSSNSPFTKTLPLSRLLLTAGAWTPYVFSTLFPNSKLRIPITPLAGHSLLLHSPRWKTGDEILNPDPEKAGCHALFTTDPAGYSPEVFSRVGGEIYIAGLNSSTIPLPELAEDRQIDPEAIKTLMVTAERLMGKEGATDDEKSDLEVLREGLCFRPVTGRGTPIVSKIDGKQLGGAKFEDGGGVWVASGHGPWGISLSLGTGCVLAEMVEERKMSADVGGLGL